MYMSTIFFVLRVVHFCMFFCMFLENIFIFFIVVFVMVALNILNSFLTLNFVVRIAYAFIILSCMLIFLRIILVMHFLVIFRRIIFTNKTVSRARNSYKKNYCYEYLLVHRVILPPTPCCDKA